MSDLHNHHERFDAKTTSVDRVLGILMWAAIAAAVFVGLMTMAPKPYTSEIGDVDAYPRTACQMVCPGPTLAGVCTVPKIPWRAPYRCIPSNY